MDKDSIFATSALNALCVSEHSHHVLKGSLNVGSIQCTGLLEKYAMTGC